jgi:ankyrin repeat protein
VLLRYGAGSAELNQTVAVKGKNAMPLLHRAASGGHTKVRHAGGGYQSSNQSQLATQMVQVLLDDAHDQPDYINSVDVRTGSTPLHYAVAKEQINMVRHLVAQGAGT